MVNWRKVGIGYLIISILVGLFIAMMFAMIPGGSQPSSLEPPGYEYDFWALYFDALPISIMLGFAFSPIFYICFICAKENNFAF